LEDQIAIEIFPSKTAQVEPSSCRADAKTPDVLANTGRRRVPDCADRSLR